MEQHQFVQKIDSFDRVQNGVVFHCTASQGQSVDIRLTVCTPHTLRFRMCPDPGLMNVRGLLEIKEDWAPCAFGILETPETLSIDTGAIRFEVRKEPWEYTIYDQSDEIVLRENVSDRDAHANYRSLPLGFTTEKGRFCRSNETFSLPPAEGYYGFGEQFTRLNKLGQRISAWNTNPYGAIAGEAYKNIPFFMSTRGYGIFVNSTYRITYDIGSRSLMTCTIMVDDPRLDLFIIYGPGLKDVLARYEEITGWPNLPPKEAFGLWCTPRLPEKSVRAAADIVTKFRELDIPLDHLTLVAGMARVPGIIHEEQVAWVKLLSNELGKLGVKTGMYVLPLLNIGSDMEQEAREKGYAIMQADGSPYEVWLGMKRTGESGESEYSLAMIERDDAWRDRHNHIFYDPCLMPDFTNPEAVKWWKGKIIDFMQAGCFFVAMSDFGEDVPADARYHSGRDGQEMHNIYQLMYQKATFEAVAEGTGHPGLINARSGTAGMQRFPICWCGDPNCEWGDLLATMRAGLSLGMSGVPFWSCDNGGFSSVVGHLTPQLWIRWSQWSMFQSNPRLHGTYPPERVPWSFGDIAVDNFRKYAKLRYRLLPYIYSHAYNATQTGLPMMRAMVLEFQDDPRTYDIEDQYMFGDAFLVAPVATPANKRTVYLPKGKWFDYWTGEKHEGPMTLHIEPPLEILPLYVRGDSIIPMGPDMAYIGEKPFDPITLDMWLCAEAEFAIYDDDGMVSCRASREEDRVVVEVSPSERDYFVKLNKTSCPSKVSLNGVAIPRLTSVEELEKAECGWHFASITLQAKFRGLGNTTKLVLRM